MSNRQLKILVELTIDNPLMNGVNEFDAKTIKLKVEENFQGGLLPAYLHSIGIYHDCEVVQVSLVETHDTRQQ